MALLTPYRSPGICTFGLLAPRTVREYTSVALSHPVCDNLVQQPQETNINGDKSKSILEEQHLMWRSRWCMFAEKRAVCEGVPEEEIVSWVLKDKEAFSRHC